MSRLEAIASGLYYPTPEPVVAALVRYLRLPTLPAASALPASALLPRPSIRLLDPCAGKGRALSLLAESLQATVSHADRPGVVAPAVELYGLEPNADRAQEALAHIPNLLVTSYFTATLSEGGFQLAFVNPPYDEASDADSTAASGSPSGSRRERLELRFLRRTTAKLASDGVLVWIVPQVRLRDAAKHLAEHYADITCWRFPDTPWCLPEAQHDASRPAVPMYASFSQVVLLARRRRVPVPANDAEIHRIEAWATMGEALTPLPLDEHDGTTTAVTPADPATPSTLDMKETPTYVVPLASTPLRYFLATTFDPDAVARHLSRSGVGVWGERSYVERHWPDLDASDLGIGQPLAPLRRGHLALLAAAGIANGQELVGTDGRRLVVKGACRKVTMRDESRDIEPGTGQAVTTFTETDHFEVALWATDLDTGEVLHIL